MGKIAFFPQDLIGDVLVWANLPKAAAKLFEPCEVVVFCTKGVAELFECMSFCNKVVVYEPENQWSREETREFGRFEAVLNTRYDADSVQRVAALDHNRAYGFESFAIPEAVCEKMYSDYVPLSRWDDFQLRRKTSVTEQGAELIRLFAPDYHCSFVRFDENEFARDMPGPTKTPRVVFVIGASDPAKSWGLENYLSLAWRVRAKGFEPLFLLGPKERGLASRILAAGCVAHRDTAMRRNGVREKLRGPVPLRAGGSHAGFALESCLPFRKLAGYFSREGGTECVVGNDTGLMHLACALGTPSVTIVPHGMHFTWFPYETDERARHICLAPPCASPLCSNDCSELAACSGKMSVDRVERAIEEIAG